MARDGRFGGFEDSLLTLGVCVGKLVTVANGGNELPSGGFELVAAYMSMLGALGTTGGFGDGFTSNLQSLVDIGVKIGGSTFCRSVDGTPNFMVTRCGPEDSRLFGGTSETVAEDVGEPVLFSGGGDAVFGGGVGGKGISSFDKSGPAGGVDDNLIDEPVTVGRDFTALKDRGKNWKKNQYKRNKLKNKRRVDSVSTEPSCVSSPVASFGQDSTSSSSPSSGVGVVEVSSVPMADVADVPSSIPVSLRASWIARKNAENLLAQKKAENELKLQEVRDLDVERAARRTKNVKLSEQYKVEIEKAFMKLKETGNSGCMTVLDETVNRLSDVAVGEEPGLTNSSGVNSGSISPNSSASMAEFRAVQKKCLDLEAEMVKLKHTNKRLQQFARLDSYEQVAFSFVDDVLAPSVQEKLDKLEEDGYNYRTDGHIEDPTLYVTKENKWTDAEFDYEFDKMK